MPFGYLVETDRDSGKVVRANDTATCGHCGLPMVLPPSKSAQVVVRVDAPCSGCRKFVCGQCKAEGAKRVVSCITWEKTMERIEARDKLIRSILG